jgi:homoserine O-succinyltransferase/O-acetyltransferase
MPIFIDGGRIPSRWAETHGSPGTGSFAPLDTRADCIRIALVNNMPDAALEDTEQQFFELLDTVSGDLLVRVKLYSLPDLPRGERGQNHLRNFYFGLDDLCNSRFDALIMTGTEPRQSDLRKEDYWDSLTAVLDWAEHNTASTILSCLAAHAGVLYSDGIVRQVLSDKQFGVFEFNRVDEHALTNHTADQVKFPHSRWNGLKKDSLTSCGYSVLTESSEAGVDSFVKLKKKSLFVHFQGHPEYGARTLLKEYARDIKRFLKGERENYPSMPYGYFDVAATRLLTDFKEYALSHRQEENMEIFPAAAVADTLQNTWHSFATRVYRNWLEYLASGKTDTSPCVAMTRAGGA